MSEVTGGHLGIIHHEWIICTSPFINLAKEEYGGGRPVCSPIKTLTDLIPRP